MALAFQPTFEPDFSRAPGAAAHLQVQGPVQIPAPVLEHPSVAQARAAASYRRRRIGFALVAVIFLYGLWSLALGVVNIAGAESSSAELYGVTGVTDAAPSVVSIHVPDSTAVSLHVVQPGETLWSIAEGLHLGGDLRSVVDQIADLNGGRTTLRPGQRLVLPAA